MIPSSPMTSYLTLTLKSLGFDTFTTNLLTIPASVLFIILLILVTWLSEMFDERLLFGVVSEIGMMAPLIALALVGKDANKWGVFTACTLLVGYIYVHAILVSLTSRNAGSVRTRTVGSAVYNMCVQVRLHAPIPPPNICADSTTHRPVASSAPTSTARATSPSTTRAIKCLSESQPTTLCSSSRPSYGTFTATRAVTRFGTQ